ncbi:MAG: flagellar hook basal-body protein [Candidatus Melainabacteria bacterium]|nr:flagellar hook basal-body protein [Candidatus Melainabacteria bacterium]
MYNISTLAANAAQSALEQIDFLTSNVINGETPGYNGKRFTFRDYLFGGTIEDAGYSWRQGKEMVRVGEPTKMMLRGKGFFTMLNPGNNEIVYTRLGDFHFDRNGYLASNEGFTLLGTPLQSNVQPHGNSGYAKLGPRAEFDIFADPFNSPAKREYAQVSSGGAIGKPQPINLAVDPTNGLYLGKYEKIRIDKSGVIWGKYGDSEVSLYKVTLRNFQNLNGLKNFRDVYWKQTSESGPALPSNALVFNEALEKSNVWTKVEIDSIIEAQRQYTAAINAHKVADKLLQQAVELVG